MLRNISIIVLFSFQRTTVSLMTSHNLKLFVEVICSRYIVLYLKLQFWSSVRVEVKARSSVLTETLIDIVIEWACFLRSFVTEDLRVSNKGCSFSSALLGNSLLFEILVPWNTLRVSLLYYWMSNGSQRYPLISIGTAKKMFFVNGDQTLGST